MTLKAFRHWAIKRDSNGVRTNGEIFSDVQTCFLSDVVEHRMKVHMDNGVYRHRILEARNQLLPLRYYDWPGYLCVTGDMGTGRSHGAGHVRILRWRVRTWHQHWLLV